LERKNKKLPQFSKGCFWDSDTRSLDFEEGKSFIIKRVLTYGNTLDEKKLFRFYGWDIIESEIVKIRYLDKKVLNYLSIIFDIKKSNFRAHENKGFLWN